MGSCDLARAASRSLKDFSLRVHRRAWSEAGAVQEAAAAPRARSQTSCKGTPRGKGRKSDSGEETYGHRPLLSLSLSLLSAQLRHHIQHEHQPNNPANSHHEANHGDYDPHRTRWRPRLGSRSELAPGRGRLRLHQQRCDRGGTDRSPSGREWRGHREDRPPGEVPLGRARAWTRQWIPPRCARAPRTGSHLEEEPFGSRSSTRGWVRIRCIVKEASR